MTKKQTEIPKMMKLAEYATHRGISVQRISAMKQHGQLAMKAGLVDATASDRLLDAEGPASGVETLMGARARKESTLASLRELDLKVRSGQLIDLEETKKLWFEKGRAIRDGLFVIPERISHVLASETDAKVIRQILRAEISQQLEALANAFAK